MNRRKPLSHLILLCLLAPVYPVQADDLIDIVSKAVANDPTLAGMAADTRYAQGSVPFARAALLPQVSGSMALAENRQTSKPNSTVADGQGATRSRQMDISLSQAIVDLKSINALRSAELAAQSQGAAYQDALQDLYLRASTAYFNVLESEMEFESYKASESAAKEVWQQAVTRNKAGLVASADVDQARVYYENSRVDTLEIEKSLKSAQQELVQIIGDEPGPLAPFPETIKLSAPTPEDEASWVHTAKANSQAILSASLALQASERSISAARADHLPTLKLGISHEGVPSWRNTGGHSRTTDNVVSLTLSVPISSGGSVNAAVAMALAARDKSASELELHTRQVVGYVQYYFAASQLGVKQVERASDAVAAASSAVSSVKTGLLAGANDMTTVLNAIDYQVQAKALYNQQLSQFFVNSLSLKRYAGTLSMGDLATVNRLLAHR